jgi:hypothetical protein
MLYKENGLPEVKKLHGISSCLGVWTELQGLFLPTQIQTLPRGPKMEVLGSHSAAPYVLVTCHPLRKSR